MICDGDVHNVDNNENIDDNNDDDVGKIIAHTTYIESQYAKYNNDTSRVLLVSTPRQASIPFGPRALSLTLTSISLNFSRLLQMIVRVFNASSVGLPAIISLISAMIIDNKHYPNE